MDVECDFVVCRVEDLGVGMVVGDVDVGYGFFFGEISCCGGKGIGVVKVVIFVIIYIYLYVFLC